MTTKRKTGTFVSYTVSREFMVNEIFEAAEALRSCVRDRKSEGVKHFVNALVEKVEALHAFDAGDGWEEVKG